MTQPAGVALRNSARNSDQRKKSQRIPMAREIVIAGEKKRKKRKFLSPTGPPLPGREQDGDKSAADPGKNDASL